MNEPTHLDLFSGIGGFALASNEVGFKTVGFCEIDPYCQAILRKHWPRVSIYGDIRSVNGFDFKGISLLTGGFPCQPFSVAGERKGKDDDRYLWPEMLRIIRQARPTWIVGENVAGIVNMALDQVHTDLEGEGYEVESLIIPACGVDAPHRRDRVWILAHTDICCDSGEKRGVDAEKIRLSEENREEWGGCGVSSRTSQMEQRRKSNRIHDKTNVADTDSPRILSAEIAQYDVKNGSKSHDKFPWRCGSTSGGERSQANWSPEPELGRVAHGVPNRVDRIKGLGNAIVPQVAKEILQGVMSIILDRAEISQKIS
jgi:DNA (cytosine-5)-methyltransferase 1